MKASSLVSLINKIQAASGDADIEIAFYDDSLYDYPLLTEMIPSDNAERFLARDKMRANIPLYPEVKPVTYETMGGVR